MRSLPEFRALVVGSSGGIGIALADELAQRSNCSHVERLSRRGNRNFDLFDEESISAMYRSLKKSHGSFQLILDATGTLAVNGEGPEKSLAALDPNRMARAFAVNTIGPALLFKHLSALLPTEGKSVFATLSARLGSIGDNRLGGWYSYRASKAALNQIVRTAAIEIARKRPSAVCVALHPGTIDTPLSRPYARGRFTHPPQEAARRLLQVLDNTTPDQTGTFLDYHGRTIPW